MIGASFDSTTTPPRDLLARAEELLQSIEAATGMSITREPDLFRAWDAEEPLEEAVS